MNNTLELVDKIKRSIGTANNVSLPRSDLLALCSSVEEYSLREIEIERIINSLGSNGAEWHSLLSKHDREDKVSMAVIVHLQNKIMEMSHE